MVSLEVNKNLENKKDKYNPVLDIVRFLAALIIISIHIFPEGSTEATVGINQDVVTLIGLSFVYALTSIAVPIFYVISSYLLFRKIELDPENRWKYIGKFCLRLLYFFLFWFIVGLPITIRDITSFISSGDTHNLVRYFVIFLWKGAPRGFFFLQSLALGVVLTCLCKTKKSMTLITIISIIMYVFACFNCSYLGVFTLSDDPVSKGIYDSLIYLETNFSFLQALIFIVLGKIFVLLGTFKIKGNIFYIPILFIFMIGELFITKYVGINVYPNYFFLLPVFTFFLMNFIFSINLKNESERLINISKRLKKIGSFSFLFHFQFFYYLHWILDSINHNIFREYIFLLIIPYLVCILICFVLQPLCERLSKHKYLSFLKYSY